MAVKLFEPITIRGLTIPRRLWVAPMCQYSAVEGVVQPWHMAHIGSWAINRAGLIITEATSVSPEGRISSGDAGLWNEDQVEAWKPITAFVSSQGVPIAVQLAHAGRKASTRVPFTPGETALLPDEGGWTTWAPSAEAFGRLPIPHEMTLEDIALVIEQFGEAAKRAIRAGFDAIEIHSAHGYLLHEFLSPISNKREDAYGGDFASRTRFVLDVVGKLRSVLPETMPLFVRISASDWIEGGWDLASSVRLSVLLEERGVDFIDVSSGGLSPEQTIELGPGYQMPFASAISKAVAIPTGTVGLITDAHQAEEALDDGVADVVLMGRQFLREPSYALRAAPELGAELPWPGQYERARPV